MYRFKVIPDFILYYVLCMLKSFYPNFVQFHSLFVVFFFIMTIFIFIMTIGQLLIAIESLLSASDPSVTVPCLYSSELFYVSAILKTFVLSFASVHLFCIWLPFLTAASLC